MLFALSCNLLGLSIAFLRSRRTPPRHEPATEVSEYPRVLVQLPAFNEGMLIERAIRAAAMDWPRDRLTIQVLDDSTDGSEEISRRVAEELRRTGVDIWSSTGETAPASRPAPWPTGCCGTTAPSSRSSTPISYRRPIS